MHCLLITLTLLLVITSLHYDNIKLFINIKKKKAYVYVHVV